MDDVVDHDLTLAPAILISCHMCRAAIKLAKLAREKGIPIMLDAEKDRPHLRTLVPLCDYITTNTVFPKEFTGR